jgi:hypothetical protein
MGEGKLVAEGGDKVMGEGILVDERGDNVEGEGTMARGEDISFFSKPRDPDTLRPSRSISKVMVLTLSDKLLGKSTLSLWLAMSPGPSVPFPSGAASAFASLLQRAPCITHAVTALTRIRG